MTFYKTLKSLHKIVCSICETKIFKIKPDTYCCSCESVSIKHSYKQIYSHLILPPEFSFDIKYSELGVLITGNLQDICRYRFIFYKYDITCYKYKTIYTLNEIPDAVNLLKNSAQIIEYGQMYVNFI